MAMATLTVKTIPDDVYQELKSQAEKHRRSLNQEIIACLEQAVLLPRPDPDAFLKEARALRKLFKGPPVTDKFLSRLKREGRL
jgi:plasmid stability protein